MSTIIAQPYLRGSVLRRTLAGGEFPLAGFPRIRTEPVVACAVTAHAVLLWLSTLLIVLFAGTGGIGRLVWVLGRLGSCRGRVGRRARARGSRSEEVLPQAFIARL